MCQEPTKPYSAMVTNGVGKFLRAWKNVLIIAPKKWFASWIICNDCGHIPHCDQCDVSIAIHKTPTWDPFGLCHICKRHYTVWEQCKQCGSTETAQYWLWTQQVAQRAQETFTVVPVIIDNKVVNSPKKIAALDHELQKAQLIIATSILATPPAKRQADCVVVLSADTWLSVPDFQASRNTFLWLYDLISNRSAEVFLVQSYNVEQYGIVNACLLDPEKMKQEEDEYRKQYGYPPHGEMCLLLYKNEIEERLHTSVNKLYQELLFLKEQYEMQALELYTAPPMIYKMFGKYRYSIVMKWPQVRQFLDIVFSKLELTKRWFKVDREPQQLV